MTKTNKKLYLRKISVKIFEVKDFSCTLYGILKNKVTVRQLLINISGVTGSKKTNTSKEKNSSRQTVLKMYSAFVFYKEFYGCFSFF